MNNTFQIPKKEGVDRFPHNNEKYNVQFLNRSLKGEGKQSIKIGLKFPVKETGYFPKT